MIQPASEGRTPAPRTAAGRALAEFLSDGFGLTGTGWEAVLRDIFAIEAEAGVRVAEPDLREAARAVVMRFTPEMVSEFGKPNGSVNRHIWPDQMEALRKLRVQFGYTDPDYPTPDHAAQPQPESGSAGTSGALREAAQAIVDFSWGDQPAGAVPNRILPTELVDELRAALAASPAEPKP